MSESLRNISEKVNHRERLSFDDGVKLFQSKDLLAIGKLANAVRERLHEKRVYYAINMHLNHTNICPVRCAFCAFSRDADEPGAYSLNLEEIEQKISEAVRDWDINEVHMVGGHNPDWSIEDYEELFQRIRHKFPQVFIKALSAPEVDDLAKRSELPVEEVLKTLKQSGLESLPGGGAEIFEPKVRSKICSQKITGKEWLEVHRTAHRAGLPSNATMLYGHFESDEDRVNHLLEIRKLQDETRGFQAFVPFPYQKWGKTALLETSGFLDMKVLSIARLILDNIPHIKVHWPATGLKFAQASLSFGADDIGGTNFHEKVMHEAGSRAPEGLSSEQLVRFIKDAGYEPQQVNSSYNVEKEKK